MVDKRELENLPTVYRILRTSPRGLVAFALRLCPYICLSVRLMDGN